MHHVHVSFPLMVNSELFVLWLTESYCTVQEGASSEATDNRRRLNLGRLTFTEESDIEKRLSG